MKSRFGLVAALMMLVLLVSCQSPGDKLPDNVVATLDGKEITVDTYRSYCGGEIPDDHSRKKDMLSELVANSIISDMAREKGYLNDPELNSRISKEKNKWLEEALEKDVRSKVEVALDELPPPPEGLGPTLNLYVILTNTLEDARKARQRVKDGEDFEEVARDMSVGPSSVAGGSLGEVPLSSSMYGEGVRAMLNSLEVGELSPVAKLRIGFGVFKVGDRTETVDVIENYQSKIRETYQKQRANETVAKLKAELREQHQVAYNESFGEPGGDNSWVGMIDGRKILYEVPSLTQAELMHMPHAMLDVEQARAAFNKEVNRMVMAEEAKNRGFNMTKEFLEFSRKLELKTIAQIYVERDIWPKAEVSEEEVRKYYEEHREEFRLFSKVTLQRILVEDEELAGELKGMLDAGADFSHLVMQHSVDKSAQDGGVIGPIYKNQAIEPINTVAFELGVGEYSDVLKTKYGYELIKILDKRGEMIAPYEQVRDKLAKKLFNERRSDLVMNFREHLFDGHEFIVNERIMKNLKG